MAKTMKSDKFISAILIITMLFTFFIFTPVSVVNAAEVKASFVNTSGDDGEDVINLCEPRSFKAMIPVSAGSVPDASTVVWSIDRDNTKHYLDKEQYPNQNQGGEISSWVAECGEPFFKNFVSGTETVAGTTYLTLTFESINFFGKPDGVPYGGPVAYLDACGYFDLTASTSTGTEIGSVAIKIVPYDTFRTMDEVYAELDEMVKYAAENTDIYVQEFSMGQSSGVIYDPIEMPYIIIAKDSKTVTDWLTFTEAAETNPSKTLKDIAAGKYNDIAVPVMFSNIHSNETAAVDGIMEFAWILIEGAAGDGELSYDKLTGFTAAGKVQLAEELGKPGVAGSVATPDLVKDTATYLGYINEGNMAMDEWYGYEVINSAPIDLEKYYTIEEDIVNIDELLGDVFFILVPEENVEGRVFMTREASNGYDLNRDNSFQTTPETQNMQKLIGTFNPVSLTELHGLVEGYQVEPCDPPHEPNFEYDLLAEHLLPGGEAYGIAAVANNDSYNSYVTPQRDYLVYTGNKTADGEYETYWADPWDDMSTSYTPQFAMLHGTVAYTVELPGYNDAAAESAKYGCLGQSDYIADEKISYITNQTKIYERGVTNFNSDEFDLVGQWFCDQYDIEGAEAELFRPEYTGAGENGNFYPEFYIIPLDVNNQSNLQAAYDMMQWLSRNDVKILLTEEPYTYNGIKYPAGTMIVSMHQAKRSVANGALYDGTPIMSWTVLYSEGITSFAETRGFDMVTVAKPAAYASVMKTVGDFMDYEDCLEYLNSRTSGFSGIKGADVIIANSSNDAVAAVNALLGAGKTVGMVTDENSAYYGDFICSYTDWLTVADEYMLTGKGVANGNLNYPEAQVITGAPSVYIPGLAKPDEFGFVYSSQVGSSYSWNYDRVAMDAMGFAVVDDPSDADIILGASSLDEAALAAVKAGTPYIAYGSNIGDWYDWYSDTMQPGIAASFFGENVGYATVNGMDCLGYVEYPNTNLINASYVLDNDDVMYGYGAGCFTEVPEGATVLVKMDGDKAPTECFIVAISDEDKAAADAYLDGSVQGFSYEGKDVDGNDIDVAFFANSLTHKGHQTDEYTYISNFIFSNMLGKSYIPASVTVTACDGKDDCLAGAYEDVNSSQWYHEAVDFAIANDIMNGYCYDEFGIGDNMTRGQLVTVLHRIEGSPKTKSEKAFTDVKLNAYYCDAVAWASENEIVIGNSDGTFKPNAAITREQLAAILYRYAQYKGVDISISEDAALKSYTDAVKISKYAISAMQWACDKDIIEGVGSNEGQMLAPKGTATREQTAAMLMRYYD